ncbi:MAG: nuclear transport factor 2 family protein [Pseudomonadota bacterium]
MKTLLAILTLVAAPAFAGAAAAHDVKQDKQRGDEADREAIKVVIQDYFDGIGAADRARLDRAFAVDNAAMVGMVKTDAGGEMRAFKDMDAVIANWASNEAPEGVGRDGEILDMMITDGRIAAVMFRYKDEYYDVLTLLKVGGEWKIATKTFLQR